MKKILEAYQEHIICIFKREDTINKQTLAILKDGVTMPNIEGVTCMYYQEDFESLLTFKVPTKIRRPKQLITHQECLSIIDEISYGVLSFTHDEIPYSVALNHTYMNGKLYFHCAKKGFKLYGNQKMVSFLITKPLHIIEHVPTHNHQSVTIQGKMQIIDDFKTKKEVLQQLVNQRAPSYHKEITEQMVNATGFVEIDIQYLIGKGHFR